MTQQIIRQKIYLKIFSNNKTFSIHRILKPGTRNGGQSKRKIRSIYSNAKLSEINHLHAI